MSQVERSVFILPLMLLGGCTLGPTELAMILAIVVLLFGASRLPALGRAMGETLRSFKSGSEGEEKDQLAAGEKNAKQLEEARVESTREADRED